jgi:hypothetical protein
MTLVLEPARGVKVVLLEERDETHELSANPDIPHAKEC